MLWITNDGTRIRTANSEGAVVEEFRRTQITDALLAVVRIEARIETARIGPGAKEIEESIEAPGLSNTCMLFEGPGGDAMIAGDLSGAVALDEIGRIGRTILGVVHVERRIDGHRIALVRDRGIEPVREHFGSARMSVRRDIVVAGKEFRRGRGDGRPEERLEIGLRRLGLIGRHQRATPRVPE
jgi:hypothetical protein